MLKFSLALFDMKLQDLCSYFMFLLERLLKIRKLVLTRSDRLRFALLGALHNEARSHEHQMSHHPDLHFCGSGNFEGVFLALQLINKLAMHCAHDGSFIIGIIMTFCSMKMGLKCSQHALCCPLSLFSIGLTVCLIVFPRSLEDKNPQVVITLQIMIYAIFCQRLKVVI
jgi:hypothetical protein